MKKIYLTGKYGSIIGNYCLVDDEDFERLNKFKWNAYKHHKSGGMYAVRHDGGKLVSIEHYIVKPPKGKRIDHIDRNGLNNQKANLRPCSLSENQWNRGIDKNNKTGFKGVSKRGSGNFRAKISANGITYHLGTFLTAREAANAYNKKAEKLHGSFAYKN